ncbi:MAG: CHAT domain-containing protein [Saprospiraceae bacterium]
MQKSLDIRLSTTPSDKKGIASAIIDLGILCLRNEELEEAEKLFFRALELRKSLFGPNHVDVASVYVNLGALYNKKGLYDKAIEFEEKALAIQKNNLDSTNVMIAKTLNNLGNSYSNLNNSKKAIELYDKALSIKIKAFGSKHPLVAATYSNLGDTYFDLKDYKKSSSLYLNAIQSCNYINDNFENVNSQYRLIDNLSKLARVNLIDNSLDESHSNIMKAISAIEYQFSSISESFTKTFWQNQSYPVYEQAIDISLLKSFRDQNDSLKYNSFYLAEQSKAGILQAQLKEMNARRFGGIPDSLVEKEQRLGMDITWGQKQRKGLLDKGVNESDTSLPRVNNTLFYLKEQYSTLKSTFEKDFPNYYRLKYARQAVSIQDIQQKMLSSKQSLVEYFVGDSSIYIFVVKPDTFVVRKVKKDFQLNYWIDSLRSGLYGYYTCKQEEKTSSKYQSSLYQYTEYANRLYQKLFAPIDKILTDQVIIVPDGMLGYIPFDALLRAKPENINDFKTYPYLLNKYQFSYAYSVTLLKEMQEKEHKMRNTKNFAAFAPYYDGDISMLSNSIRYDSLMRKGLRPLIHSGEEVASASKIMNGDIFAGKTATKSKFTSIAGNYKILHLASHAHADQGVGDYSYISFTGDTVSYEQLYVQDLYNLQINADMVVLSACQTGIGKLERGEGIISLARAFAYAGAKSIINSLWEVNDKSSSALMKYFYKELKKGKTKDNALRLAKKTYLEKTTVRGAHPFFWAAFIPIGDMSKL